MRMGLMIDAPHEGNAVDGYIDQVKRAADEGFASVWTPQLFETDAVTLCALAGREVPGIELGTAVVPTFPRHPFVLASQALTAQAASRGRFVLGIGLSHQVVIEAMLDREHAAGPADVAMVGSDAEVAKGVEAVADAGATDFIAAVFGSDAQQTRTRQLLLSMR